LFSLLILVLSFSLLNRAAGHSFTKLNVAPYYHKWYLPAVKSYNKVYDSVDFVFKKAFCALYLGFITMMLTGDIFLGSIVWLGYWNYRVWGTGIGFIAQHGLDWVFDKRKEQPIVSFFADLTYKITHKWKLPETEKQRKKYGVIFGAYRGLCASPLFVALALYTNCVVPLWLIPTTMLHGAIYYLGGKTKYPGAALPELVIGALLGLDLWIIFSLCGI
jgi:hypothetical protein